MTQWEYSTIPLLTHATKAILDQWGADGWELVQVVPGPTGSENLVAYLQRPRNPLRFRTDASAAALWSARCRRFLPASSGTRADTAVGRHLTVSAHSARSEG